jgi:hypothetical protein
LNCLAKLRPMEHDAPAMNLRNLLEDPRSFPCFDFVHRLVTAARHARKKLCVIALFCSASLNAAPPTIDYVFPAGARQGSSLTVTLGGKFEPWPAEIWADHPSLKFKPEETKGKFSIQIATNTPVGPHLIRVFNPDGASSPRCFMIGHMPEVTEKEPNDSFEKAHPIDGLPVTINGRFDKIGDADCFDVHLSAGQCLVAWVDAYGFDAPVDPVLQLLRPDRTKAAFNHDGRSLDPWLTYRAEETGRHILQVSAFSYPPKADVRLTGSDSSIYRLSLTTGPVGEYAFPAGVQRGHSAPLQLFGWNLGSTGRALSHDTDASRVKTTVDRLLIGPGVIENQLNIMVGDYPEQIEAEPNDTRDLAQRISIPCAVNGRVAQDKDEDRFEFVAKKGERFKFTVQSAALGLPLDAVAAIEDREGKQLARSDDAGSTPDPELNWTASVDGSYFLVVNDLLQRGSSNRVYRCTINHPEPDFRAVIEGDAVRIEPGKSAELKVNVARLNDFPDHLNVLVEQLPDGVTSTAPSVPSKGGEVKVVLSASADAKPAQQPIRVIAISPNPEAPRVRVAAAKLKGQNAAAGGMLINETEQVWLTILPKPSEKPAAKEEPKKD